MIIVRVGRSTDRVTQGISYTTFKQYGAEYINDDNGNIFRFSKLHNYWLEQVKNTDTLVYKSLSNGKIMITHAQFITYYKNKNDSEVRVDEIFNTRELANDARKQYVNQKVENKMLHIQEIITINDISITNLSTTDIIEYVIREKESIEKLNKVSTDSKTIKAIQNKHKKNIIRLLEILDTKQVD